MLQKFIASTRLGLIVNPNLLKPRVPTSPIMARLVWSEMARGRQRDRLGISLSSAGLGSGLCIWGRQSLSGLWLQHFEFRSNYSTNCAGEPCFNHHCQETRDEWNRPSSWRRLLISRLRNPQNYLSCSLITCEPFKSRPETCFGRDFSFSQSVVRLRYFPRSFHSIVTCVFRSPKVQRKACCASGL